MRSFVKIKPSRNVRCCSRKTTGFCTVPQRLVTVSCLPNPAEENCRQITNTVNLEIFARVYFLETSHMRSFVKIKPSRNVRCCSREKDDGFLHRSTEIGYRFMSPKSCRKELKANHKHCKFGNFARGLFSQNFAPCQVSSHIYGMLRYSC